MKNVLIVHGYTTEYRVPFFKELNRILSQSNISLKVLIGQTSKFEKFGEIEKCDFFINVKNWYFYFGQRYLIYEPIFKHLKYNDLIIIRQAKRHLVNPFVYLYCRLNGINIAFWGNMKEFISKKVDNRFNPLINKVDHWFAYNDVTKRLLILNNYPEDNITSLNNSIDTKNEREIYHTINNEELISLRHRFDINDNDVVGIFCSRLYPDKRIDFLLETISKIKSLHKNFKFIVIGSGSEENKIMTFEKKNSAWFYWTGSKYGKEKIKYFRLADFQLIPGAVGLHIVDSFALETPIITANHNSHGVEIDYLKNNVNGIITENNLDIYVSEIVRLCNDDELKILLKNGCKTSAEFYTIEKMANNFANGILKCLNKN